MSKAARELAALRRKVNHKCGTCGTGFRGNKTARYCSNACRQKAKYKRAKESSGDSA